MLYRNPIHMPHTSSRLKTTSGFVAVVALALLLLVPALRAESVTLITDVNPDRSDTDGSDPDGATGGRVNGLAATPGNDQILYAASEWGGIYKSTDAGRTWTHLQGHVPMATWDVEVDPADTDRVYATSFYDGRVDSIAGINVSSDAGSTWTHPASAAPPAGFCANANDQVMPSAFGISVDPVSNANVFIGTNCGLAVSNDSGATWTYKDPTPGDGAGRVWDVVAHGNGVVDVCGGDGHLRSNDGGNSWIAGTGLPSGRCSLAVSPDESYVLIAVVGTTLYETTNADAAGGATWTQTRVNPRRQGRIPFVETNQRPGSGFDLWFGDVQLHRVGCTTPSSPASGGAPRCGTGNSPAWVGPYTRSRGGHDDTGAILFDSDDTSGDRCPVLMSSDGGVYYNTITSKPGCHAPLWEQPTVTPHGLWLFTMSGTSISGDVDENLYFGNQDNGVFGTVNAGMDAPTWHNEVCCDGFDTASEDDLVVWNVCCYGGSGRRTRFFRSDEAMTSRTEIQYPPSGLSPNFKFADSIANYGPKSYVMITRNCSVGSGGCPGSDGGVFVTSDITAGPVTWTELGNATEPPSNQMCGVQVSRDGAGDPVFLVQTGNCNQASTSDRLFRYDGTDPGGTWSEITLPFGGFGAWTVHPEDADRIMAAGYSSTEARIYETTDGGGNWTRLDDLEDKMTGGGIFRMRNNRGPVWFTGFSGYWQPLMLAYNPYADHVRVAGATDSGVFLSTDYGEHWRVVTDPLDPGTSGVPHISRVRYAYFDNEEPQGVYVGTKGRGIWKLTLENTAPVALCASPVITPGPGCTATATVDDVDDGSFDPDSEFEIAERCIVAVDGDPVPCVNEVNLDGQGGAHTLTLRVTDHGGLSSTCESTVDVEDLVEPVITSLTGVAADACYFSEPVVSATATDNCDPDPVVSIIRNDEPDTDGDDPACDARSLLAEAIDDAGNVGSGCAGSPCPVPYSVNPNDCDADGIPDCAACDLFFEMACMAANCSKLQFGTGAGDGKINITGSLGLGACPAAQDPLGILEPTDRVQVRLDGTLVFDEPWGSFSKGSQNVWKYRAGSVSMLLHFDQSKWKLSDRNSNLTAGDVDNSDGVEHTLVVGRHSGSETLAMSPKGQGIQSCRHGKSEVDCGN